MSWNTHWVQRAKENKLQRLRRGLVLDEENRGTKREVIYTTHHLRWDQAFVGEHEALEQTQLHRQKQVYAPWQDMVVVSV